MYNVISVEIMEQKFKPNRLQATIIFVCGKPTMLLMCVLKHLFVCVCVHVSIA